MFFTAFAQDEKILSTYVSSLLMEECSDRPSSEMFKAIDPNNRHRSQAEYMFFSMAFTAIDEYYWRRNQPADFRRRFMEAVASQSDGSGRIDWMYVIGTDSYIRAVQAVAFAL